MFRSDAIELLDRLHGAQNDLYGGGSLAAVEELLTPDITWTVPGGSVIAGTYRGPPAVRDYFQRRRDLADRTFRLIRRDLLVGDGSRVAALTEGSATIGGVEHRAVRS
jgi:ketosteroid isomerase-like protein